MTAPVTQQEHDPAITREGLLGTEDRDPGPAQALPRPPAGLRQEGSFALAWAIAAIAVAAFYCVGELCYNMTLVEFVSSANTSADAFRSLETAGKCLGAAGLSMALVRLVFSRWKAVIAFALLAPLAYVGIDRGFAAYIDSLPHAARVEGYYLGAYRAIVLSGGLEDPDFQNASTPVELKLRLLNLPLLEGSGKGVQKAVETYVFGSKDKTRINPAIAGLWAVYSGVASRIEPLYDYYAIQSRRAMGLRKGFYQRAYFKAFEQKTGGIPPGLDRSQFLAAVERSYPALASYRASVVIPAQPQLGLAAVRMEDIPSGLDRQGFQAFFDDYLARARAAQRSASEHVDKLPHAEALISSSFIPPLSMSLSLFSFALNASAALAGLLLLPLWPWRQSRGYAHASHAAKLGLTAAALAWMVTRPPVLTGDAARWARVAQHSDMGTAWIKAINAEAAVLEQLYPALPAIHDAFIDDKHPGQVKKVRIQKAKPVDYAQMDRTIAGFKKAQQSINAPEPVQNFHADESRLNDKGYYGEIRPAGGNPYASSP